MFLGMNKGLSYLFSVCAAQDVIRVAHGTVLVSQPCEKNVIKEIAVFPFTAVKLHISTTEERRAVEVIKQ